MGRTAVMAFGLGLSLLLMACGDVPADDPAGEVEDPVAGEVDEPVVVLARDDGWRDGLMESAGQRYMLIEVATGAGAAQEAWDDNVSDGLTQREGAPDQPGVYVPFDEVDLETHAIVVVSSGTSSSCPAWPDDVRLTDSHIEVDLATDAGADAACTDDFVPYRAVLAVEHDRLPMADALPIEDIDVPSENLTGVDGVMTTYPAG